MNKILLSLAFIWSCGTTAVSHAAVNASAESAFATPTPAAVNPVPKLNKIVWVWLENTSDYDMNYLDYVNEIFFAHPSVRLSHYIPSGKVYQANAFSLVTGTDHGILDNDPVRVAAPSLVSLWEAKKISWRVYAEQYPGSCYLGTGRGEYRRSRVPFLSLNQVQNDRYLCMKVVNYKSLDEDVKNSTLPQMSVIIPGIQNSGSQSIYTAAYALQNILDPILNNADLMKQTTVIISTINSNASGEMPREMFTFILGNGVNAVGLNVNTPYTNANLLRTIEDGLRIGNLNQSDATATPMVGFWKP